MAIFEREFLGLFENLKRQLQAQPLNLGGIGSVGGGAGGPPGGFLGSLPQTRISFDETEAEDYYIPPTGIALPSGRSLLTNLNRIRYRIAQLESGSAISGINIEKDNTFIGSASVLNFMGGVNVVDNGSGKVTVTVTASGGGGAAAFTDLTDVPSSYSGQSGKIPTVLNDETGLEFTPKTVRVSNVHTNLMDGEAEELRYIFPLMGIENYVPASGGTYGVGIMTYFYENGTPIFPSPNFGSMNTYPVVWNFIGMDVDYVPETGTLHIAVPSGGGIPYVLMGEEGSTPTIEANTIITRPPLKVFNPSSGVARLQLYQEYQENGTGILEGSPPLVTDFVGPFIVTKESIIDGEKLTVTLPEIVKHKYNEIPSLVIPTEVTLPVLSDTETEQDQGNNPIVIPITIPDVPDRLILVKTGQRGGVGIDDVEFDGASITKIAHNQPGGDVRTEMWYMLNPPVGTYNVEVYSSNNDQVKITAVDLLYNVDQVNPFHGTFATNSGSSDGSTISVPSTEDTLVVDITTYQGGTSPATADSGQTDVLSYTGPNAAAFSSTKNGMSSSTTMSWTLSTGQPWATIGIAINGTVDAPYYATELVYLDDTLRVYNNRERLFPSEFTEGLDNQSFLVSIVPSGLMVDYDYLDSDNPVGGYGLGGYGEEGYGL